VLPGAAAVFDKTRIRTREIAGIACIVLSAACIGLSRLAVTMTPAMLTDVPLLLRTAFLVGSAILFAVLLGLLGSKSSPPRTGYLLTLSAGLWLGTTAPGVGFMSVALQRLPQGISGSVALVGGLALLVAIVDSVLGVGTTQQAFRSGPAHVLVPMQYLPIQIIPLLSFFLVFRPFTPPAISIVLVIAGIAGIAIGAGLLR
jgi:hypothetical protein